MITIGGIHPTCSLPSLSVSGAIFELPILSFFWRSWALSVLRDVGTTSGYSILIIFVIAAIVTPTTDILKHVHFCGGR